MKRLRKKVKPQHLNMSGWYSQGLRGGVGESLPPEANPHLGLDSQCRFSLEGRLKMTMMMCGIQMLGKIYFLFII